MGQEIVGIKVVIDGKEVTKTAAEIEQLLKNAEIKANGLAKAFGDSDGRAKAAADQVRALTEALEQANKPTGTLRQQLKEASQELAIANEKFGSMSTEAADAAKKVAGLRDQMQDANSLADAFNPDQKFRAFSQALVGVAGGFAAVQGGMALLGVKSDEVEKTLLKVQAAMALSQGLNGVLDSIQSFKNLGAVLSQMAVIQKANALASNIAAGAMKLFGFSVETSAGAFKVLKTAIAATGIGLLLVLLGEAYSAFQSYANAADDAAASQKRLNESILEYGRAGRDAELDKIGRDEKLAVARAKAAGESEQQISQIQQDHQQRRIGTLSRYHQETNGLDAKSKNDLQNAETDFQVKQLETEQRAREERKAAADKAAQEAKVARDKASAEAKAARDKALEEQKQALADGLSAEQSTREEINKLNLTEEQREQYDLSLKYSERVAAYEKIGKDTTDLIEAYGAIAQGIYDKYRDEEAQKAAKDLEDRQAKEAETLAQGLDDKLYQLDSEKAGYDARREYLRQFNQDLLSNTNLTEEQRNKLYKEASEARKKIDQSEAASKKQALSATANALSSFAELAGEQTAAGKALAVASATINTYLAAQEAFTSLAAIPIVGPALGALAAAAAVASGVLNIKKILSVKVPGKGGDKGGGAALPTASGGTTAIVNATAPITPDQVNGPKPGAVGAAQAGNTTGLGTTVVSEYEMTITQQRRDRIEAEAAFGKHP